MSVAALVERVEAVDGVDGLRLVGSRERGDPTPLSDWDYEVDTTEFDAVAARLHEAVAPLHPLADFWDPLGQRPNYIVVLDGPIKVDLIFAGHPFTPSAPWAPGPDTLGAIDAHFWDWTLWLGAKQRRGEHELVEQQLVRQHEHLLAPMGVVAAPISPSGAIEAYLDARERQEQRFGVRVDRRLGRQVQDVLTALG